MTTKVSLYLDERTIGRLRQRAVRERGTMRSLSKEVAELVAESFVLDELEAALAEGHRDGTASVGFGDVRPLKVSPGPSTTQMIRVEREHRHEASPRHKRGH
ncbi:MAG: hypothetical protein E6K13_08105 [Methanobacteriota archaeon]|nr:MAG: hypothetical protein E6K13_08105 [Euryarchaeota archaeon]